jgi:hypothetical protein
VFREAAGKHIKETEIFFDVKAVVTAIVTDEEKPEADHQSDFWDDERQQVLDDYD